MARHVTLCHLRWSDMDAYGHVNNAAYNTLLEEARIALVTGASPHRVGASDAAAADGPDLLTSGVVVARHEIDYLRPLTYRADPVRVETWLVEARRASFRVAYEMFDGPKGVDDGGAPVARAQTVLVPYDLAAGRPRRLGDAERAQLEQWRDTA